MPESLFDDVEDAEIEAAGEADGDEDEEEYEDEEDSQENPVTNRGEEVRPEQAPPGTQRSSPPSGAPGVRTSPQHPTASNRLVMVFDSSGRPKVALTVNGQRVENFRDPTPQEWAMFKARGYMVKGGLSGDEGAANDGGGLVGMLRRNSGMLALIAAVAAGGGYYWWSQKKARTNDDDFEADDDLDLEDDE